MQVVAHAPSPLAITRLALQATFAAAGSTDAAAQPLRRFFASSPAKRPGGAASPAAAPTKISSLHCIPADSPPDGMRTETCVLPSSSGDWEAQVAAGTEVTTGLVASETPVLDRQTDLGPDQAAADAAGMPGCGGHGAQWLTSALVVISPLNLTDQMI